MKKLMAMAIVFVLAGATNSFALFGLEDISHDGSIEYVGKSASNETDLNDNTKDSVGNTNTRVRVGINATVTEGVKARVEFMRPGGSSNFGRTANDTLTTEEGKIQISNAYLDFEELFGLKTVRLGRQYVGEAGDLVWNIAPTDDDLLPTAQIDGLLLEGLFVEEKLGIEVFTGKTSEDEVAGATDTDAGDTLATGGGDINLTAVHVNLNIIPNGRVRLGLLSGHDQNTTTVGGVQNGDDNKLRTYRVGVDGSVNEGFFTYRAEFLQNAGSYNGVGPMVTAPATSADLDYGGNAIDLGAGVNLDETGVGSFSFGINYVMASGDDNVTDNDDDSFHDFTVMGFGTSDRLYGEILGKSNHAAFGGLGGPVGLGVNSADVTSTLGGAAAATQGPGKSILHLSAQYDPNWCEKGWIRIDFFNANTSEDSIQTAAATTTNIDGGIGSEVDVTLGYNQSANVLFEAGYAVLAPGDALVGITNGFASPIVGPDDNIEKWFFRSKVKWGGEEE